ncbi:hypothetical protein QW180_00050 [Vibrio sinaloensis]|nr:hypothetical protein [Vibrio sinaloensis]
MGSSSRPDYAISLNFGFADYGSFDIAQYAHLNTVFHLPSRVLYGLLFVLFSFTDIWGG